MVHSAPDGRFPTKNATGSVDNARDNVITRLTCRVITDISNIYAWVCDRV